LNTKRWSKRERCGERPQGRPRETKTIPAKYKNTSSNFREGEKKQILMVPEGLGPQVAIEVLAYVLWGETEKADGML